jgi:hypothetical protein
MIFLLLGGRKVFHSFLRCEYSEENILFWLACEDYKKERSPAMIKKNARIIYEDYVSIHSPREVSRLLLFDTKDDCSGKGLDLAGNLRILNFAPPRLGLLASALEVAGRHTLPF